ncbi:MAG: MG2 domain-containing protein, partial [Betaproteobacteria bacterium]|nr:MG2 domain-containing protein [Betaproteobacteria bacterium]
MSFHLRFVVRVLTGLGLALLAVGCDLSGPKQAPEVPPQDASWSQLISAHTTGIVSRKSRLRVVFVSDVAGKEQVGRSAADFIESDPSIDGSATFASEREIVVLPKGDLQAGRHYRVAVRGKGLLGIPEKLQKYEFVFQVIAQDIDVNIAGLSAKEGDDREMLLKGSVVTADEEEAARLEKVLAARLAEKPLAIQWQHAGDGRHHDFTVSGIARGSESQTLKLSWDGEVIGVKNKGNRDIEVPARDTFKVTSIQAVREEQQYVRILFSDSVDPKQNLKGMVRLGRGGYTARVTGNAVALYPDRGLDGEIVVTVEPGVRNTKGGKLEKAARETVIFSSEKPRVRFSGKGVILPDNDTLSVSFEAINVRSVQVTAFRVFDNNMGQFLQANKLDGAHELGRVGRYLWRRTVHLNAPESNKWGRYAFDVTKLFKDNPGGMFRLVLSVNRAGSAFACPGAQQPEVAIVEPKLNNEDDHTNRDVSSWDFAEQYFGVGDDKSTWRDREDPCKNAYFRFGKGVRDARNLLASNIGLLAKRDQRGRLFIVATDLRSAKPSRGVKLSAMNYQNQTIGLAESDGDGFAELKATGKPFYVLAEKDGQKGYLKLTEGVALPVSHFDVGGEKVVGGIKGYIYGERGVWRPGDEIFLTFVLQDKEHSLPPGHPVTLEFYNPKNQLIQSQTNGAPVAGMYRFTLKTASDAPTGDWTAKALLGGKSFTRTVKVETVMPNRLKVELDFGKPLLKASEPLRGKLFGQWLNGATAGGLNADIKARFAAVPTRFERFADFIWDDPAREFSGEPETLFEGKLDNQGFANVSHELAAGKNAPGMLSATFTSRVFERGGAFSVSRISVPYSPFDSYLGIRLPKGDQSRNMLLTDKIHTVELASLSADGQPVSMKSVQVTLYKVEWRWWWDKSGDSLAQYATASHASVVQKNQVSTVNGRGEWKFEIKYPAWGRYLVRACDASGGHCTGQVFYIDWPGWAGRAQEQAGPGANALSFVSDKQEYAVGETAKIQLPETSQGRALVSVESGSALIDSRWIELAKGRTQFELPIAQGMSPNVYVSVTLIQPHAEKKNDRPIRLYGVIPIKVIDPATRLKPVVKAADEWAPEAKVSVEVSEQNGRAMAYTLAVVDEGLLGLTGFKTPDLHGHFYKREALGVTTWDLFDDVAGAYGGELERLLALGGSDGATAEDNKADKKRFPPVVRFLGPFELKARSSAKHSIDLPSYVGAVRVMVVAAKDAAYGASDKSVFVRQPLMILPTVPRVVGPEEEISVPVSIFAMDPSIRQVELKIEPGEYFEAVGGDSTNVAFARPDEKLGMLKLRVKSRLGKGTLRFSAVS